MAPPSSPPALLFTAFEPSGDDHAASVIRELKRLHPAVPIIAWGGPKMARAGAEILERTGDDAVMGVPGLQKIKMHRKLNERIFDVMRTRSIALHVPVDSPGANFSICKYARAMGIGVVHLVAPQIWAWGRWRIHKLRARTNFVLCLLPFEETFFLKRRVPAKFIGHPLFDRPLDLELVDRRMAKLGLPPADDHYWNGGSRGPRIAIMPGSRPSELRRHFPILLEAFRSLKREFPGTTGVVAAVNQDTAAHLRRKADQLGGWPADLTIIVGDTEAVTRWCDVALVKSGTTTLQLSRQQRPMIIFYCVSPLFYHGFARWIVATKFFTLPNALAHREIVPELVPYFGSAGPLIEKARALLRSPEQARLQREELGRVCELFNGRNAARTAAEMIAKAAGLGAKDQPKPPSSEWDVDVTAGHAARRA